VAVVLEVDVNPGLAPEIFERRTRDANVAVDDALDPIDVVQRAQHLVVALVATRSCHPLLCVFPALVRRGPDENRDIEPIGLDLVAASSVNAAGGRCVYPHLRFG